MEPHERLRIAQENANFKGHGAATAAARRFHWNENTYRSHANGQRPLSKKAAARYAKAFKVSSGWLLYGEGEPPAHATPIEPRRVPLVGFVGAGAQMHLLREGQGPFDEIQTKFAASEDTVAVEVRGESLGSFFDRWLVFYDDVQQPVTPQLIGELCVIGLADGRVLIKKLKRGRHRGRFDLYSNVEPPIYDVSVEWAARVINMAPR